MNRKQLILTLAGIFLVLAGSVNASIISNSSYSIESGEPTIVSSILISPVPLIREIKPIQPSRILPQSGTKTSALLVSSGLNNGQHTGLSPSEILTLLGSSRVLNHETLEWESFTWSPTQRETIITGWMASTDRVGSSRDMGSDIYYNSDKPVASKRLTRSEWRSFRERFLKKED